MPRKKSATLPALIEPTHLDRIISDGYHNAFTDLALHQGDLYLAWRAGSGHNPIPPGNVKIARSTDQGYNWQTVHMIDTGGDDRDPKFFPFWDERLGVVFGTYYPRWEGNSAQSLTNAEHDLISYCTSTRNGTAWSCPWQVHRPNYWMWSVLRNRKKLGNVLFYAVSYHFGGRHDLQSVHLLASSDAVSWYTKGAILENDDLMEAAEPVIWWSGRDEMSCLVRTDKNAIIGRASAPYFEKWTWFDVGQVVHAAAVQVVDGRTFIAGRQELPKEEPVEEADSDWLNISYEDQMARLADQLERYRTALWELVGDELLLRCTLPSGGDTSYPGLVYLDTTGELLLSYYSMHEYDYEAKGLPKPADIYLARFKL